MFKKIVKSYLDNIFTGKIESLLGLILFGVTIYNYIKNGSMDATDYALLVGGLALLGVNFTKPKTE